MHFACSIYNFDQLYTYLDLILSYTHLRVKLSTYLFLDAIRDFKHINVKADKIKAIKSNMSKQTLKNQYRFFMNDETTNKECD